MIIGHKKQLSILKECIKRERIPHAFLFYGEEKIGKKRVAIEFAKILNCKEKDLEKRPCLKCDFCKAIEEKRFPDLVIIEPEKVKGFLNRREIKISQIRELMWKLSLKNYIGSYKVAIIDDAHFMKKDAQSTLLKTLEEPKGRSIIILISSLHKLILPTILSRTEKIKFTPPEREEIEKFLEDKINQLEREKLYFFSQGKIGKIIEYIKDPSILEKEEKRLSYLQDLTLSPLYKRFDFIKESLEKGEISEILESFFIFFRHLFLSKLGVSKKRILKNEEYFLSRYNLKDLQKILKLILNINTLLSFTNINPKLALEILFLEI